MSGANQERQQRQDKNPPYPFKEDFKQADLTIRLCYFAYHYLNCLQPNYALPVRHKLSFQNVACKCASKNCRCCLLFVVLLLILCCEWTVCLKGQVVCQPCGSILEIISLLVSSSSLPTNNRPMAIQS